MANVISLNQSAIIFNQYLGRCTHGLKNSVTCKIPFAALSPDAILPV